ncbi:TIGR03915 family putative DNA repair protein [Fusibacter bizertensis]
MVYLYDGTFEGALSAIYQMFHDKGPLMEQQLKIRGLYQYALFEQVVETQTDAEKASKVVTSIIDTFGEDAFRRIGYAYLSEDVDFGTKLFRCLKQAYKLGERGMENYSDESIMALYKCYNAVARESHIMLGLIRFAELDKGIYYARFEPTYDLIGLMVPHFKERLGDQLWVIHDTKRRKAAFYNKETVHFSDLDPIESLYYSSKEENYQKMWKAYFDHIAIDERKNPKRHQQMMPKKYWNFLTEKTVK